MSEDDEFGPVTDTELDECRERERRCESPASQAGYDAVYELEKWNNSHKAHAVSIDIDNGYGATCWTVTLYKGRRKVVCSETDFIVSEGVDPTWQEHDGDLYCAVVDGNEMDDWPGLNATIKRAIECAEKFFAS